MSSRTISKLEPKYNRRIKKVYDACAGRVRRLVVDKNYAVSVEDLREIIAPDDVLLEYSKIDWVPIVDNPDLPNSDLMAAIHYYASHYFKATGQESRLESFDGTALIAMAVVLEEKMKDILGPNGHLCFAQQQGADEDDFEAELNSVFVAADSDDVDAETRAMALDESDSGSEDQSRDLMEM